MDPADLINVLRAAIEDVIDMDAYNQELAAQDEDDAKIADVRNQTTEFLRSLIEPPETET